jgi:serine/threonine protein phosphatase 1
MTTPDAITCVIGDVHGCNASLALLLQKVQRRADTLVFLGDYIDRGPQSKQVVTTILKLQKEHPRVITLMGNHEFLFLQYLEGRDSAVFLQAGGRQTLADYGIDPTMSIDEANRRLPPEHLAFFRSLPLLWQDQHAVYVHAGLQPGRHLSQQTSQWCLWARDQFVHSSYDFGKPVVFGHTIFDEPYLTPDKIGIDTGAVYGGKLTALLLPTREVISVPGHPATR